MADTTARPAVLPAARCRSPMCPRAGSAAVAPRSSILRPTARSARSPRRHMLSRSANAGSCNQPAVTGCAGKSRLTRARHCAAGAARRRRSRYNTANAAMNASWAVCCNHGRGYARFRSMEPSLTVICATLWRISHVLGGAAAKVLWTIRIRTVTLFITPA